MSLCFGSLMDIDKLNKLILTAQDLDEMTVLVL